MVLEQLLASEERRRAMGRRGLERTHHPCPYIPLDRLYGSALFIDETLLVVDQRVDQHKTADLVRPLRRIVGRSAT